MNASVPISQITSAVDAKEDADRQKVAAALAEHVETQRRSFTGGWPPVGAVWAFIEKAKTHSADECLLWPFAVTARGYAKVGRNGKTLLVCRIVCEHVNGAPLSPILEAAHSCGRGLQGCVAGNHLSWKTRKDNAADKLLHGTSGRGENNTGSKLTESQVLRIANDNRTRAAIASEHGVCRQTVDFIKNGTTWGWLTKIGTGAAA